MKERPLAPEGESVSQSDLIIIKIERVYRRQVLFLLYSEFRNFRNYTKTMIEKNTNKQEVNDHNSPLGVRGYKNIFIDLDDTLWDFHANAQAALEEIYNNHQLYNHFNSFEHYFNIYAKRNLELWELYGKGEITKEFLNFERFSHPLVQVGAGNIKIAEQIGREFLEMLPTKTLLVAHAKELLDYLYPKYPLTIISNGFIEVQYKKLRSANLEHYFTHIVLSEGAKALKPDKRIYEYAMQLNNATASECLMIGDSYEADIVGARNAGIDQVYYQPSITPTEKQSTYHIKTLEEVKLII